MVGTIAVFDHFTRGMMYTCDRAGKYVGAVLGAARVQYLSNTKTRISQKKT